MLGCLIGLSITMQSPPVFAPYRRPITTWIPPYAVAKSRSQVEASFGDVGFKEGITHLDLQFWVPTKEGGVRIGNFPEVNEAAINQLRDWGHANGVRVMLCIYNGEKSWDWPLAKAAFVDHRADFIKNLVAEMDRRGLDGIDVDLEGPGDFDADKPAFLAFMTELSQVLRKRGKHLSVDSFCYKWNAPNQTWWADLFPLVDMIASMGYEETGVSGADWRSYDAQVKAAGSNPAKLQLGMPSDRDQWQGNSSIDQLQWVLKDGNSGVAIWDAQLPALSWRGGSLWRNLRDIRRIEAK